jgi:hypothetical protein
VQLSPQVTFHGVARSAALEADVLDHIARLETFYPAITGCRVLVELRRHRHRSGNPFHVRIDLTVPGEEIVVSHDPSLHGGLKDAQQSETAKADEVTPEHRHARVAIRDAFDVARRRLQDHSRRQRGFVKVHTPPEG